MRQWEQGRQEWQRGCLPVCVGNAAVSGSVPGMREKVLRPAKGKEKGTAAHGVQGCHAVCIGGAAGRIFCRKCMEGDGERTLELHGEKGFMAAEVRWMNEGVRMNEPLERLLLSFAARSRVRKSRVLRRCSRLQSGAAETLSTLCRRRYKNSRGGLKSKGKWQPCLPESVWRGRIMEIMPLAILAYLQVASGEFLDALMAAHSEWLS